MGKSIAVLGLGRYGRNLAEELYRLGAEIMVVDRDTEIVRSFADKSEVAVCADLENEEEVKALGLKNMDVVVVAMGSSLAASVLCVSIAREEGVPRVIVKTSSERAGKLMLRIGADEIVYPEQETARRSARLLTSKTLESFFDVDENLCLAEIKPKKAWLGKSLAKLNLRQKYNMNVVAVRRNDGQMWAFVDPQRELSEETTLLVAVEKKMLKELE